MRRRRLLALAAGAAGLAGCSNADPDSPTGSPDDGPAPSPTGTPSSPNPSTPTDGPTASPTPEFDPTIVYANCEAVVVVADRYDAVTLVFEDRTERRTGPYEGEHRFEAETTIYSAVVHRGDREAERANPDLESCVATPTEPSPTPTGTDPRENVELFVQGHDPGEDEGFTAVADIRNRNDFHISFELTFYYENSVETVIGTITVTGELRANGSGQLQRTYTGRNHESVVAADGEISVERYEGE